ncbi:phosphomannomutase [Roseicyclus sp. F158]|uniref:Phosphomannomutase n=1 Tax=Tropicimonas omnivorans TaxID=3075590 RepID=A0ABU3DF34_9RHOB|nr:phosphomannomutase [Roseicyclus sp. F158]MDT0682323.1 phosphomannomutase [Roseicyclus sp. F158]
MAAKFGTSGLRGLVTELGADVVGAHVAAFARACPTGGKLLIGRDLRASSPRIAGDVADAARAAGLEVTECGAVPTPALALAANKGGAAAIMVTGSHIPDDRNGLKFYTRGGAEIGKTDEAAITAALSEPPLPVPGTAPNREAEVRSAYAARYLDAFGPDALSGYRLGLYEHSSVARDLLAELLTSLGAQVLRLGRADRFVPVDTEAVSPETAERFLGWSAEHGLDAILSTDGDADRPLLTDGQGRVIPGDLLGLLTARAVDARIAVTPVSSNTAIEASGALDRVIRTKIGSPYVIAGMEGIERAVGFEANGGFLLGFDAQLVRPLPRLMTRDAALPLIAPLVLARQEGTDLAGLLADLPARHRAADRLQEIDTGKAQDLIAHLTRDGDAREQLLGAPASEVDLTDGLRMRLPDGDIVHLRLSGNAPELRCYAEAATDEAAHARVSATLAALKPQL